ncbi:hypothetical protein [Bacteriovorax sp. DB6_IX]|uniref:hypothetical protein n=1 Tax=Bacteriovorax sp. DB6_IX TaxID=1353530 RepID=UPI000425BD94|nr:hypothetical protein [Bacteriovorax sp. DB6_IX]
MKKKVEGFSEDFLVKKGYIYDSLELIGDDQFGEWYEKQFSRKLKRITCKENIISSFTR